MEVTCEIRHETSFARKSTYDSSQIKSFTFPSGPTSSKSSPLEINRKNGG